MTGQSPDDELRCCRVLIAVEPPTATEGFDVVEAWVSACEAGYFEHWLHLAYGLSEGDIRAEEFRRIVAGFPAIGAERFRLLADPRWTLVALGERRSPGASRDGSNR